MPNLTSTVYTKLFTPSINLKGLNFVKEQTSLSIDDVSSGEYHLLLTLIGLFSNVKENSIILIDEPEISLHPNWQMKYITFLKSVFANFNSCHFILTSHSHFIVSDLEGDSSKVIGLTKGDNIEVVPLARNLNTFGWSAEDVLYNVFQVTTTRNYFVAIEIGEILKIVAKKDIDFTTLNSKKDELEKIKSSLKNTDPLKSLIDKVQKEFLNV